MELLDLVGCDVHNLTIFITDQPGDLVVRGGPGWPHRCDTCNAAWVHARLASDALATGAPATTVDVRVEAEPEAPAATVRAEAEAPADPVHDGDVDLVSDLILELRELAA